ncbi:repressor LexA [Anoxybacter fermentans]|uniref:LexA repressor n=2 Tax=Anoxybacter fermentans TaxID=1323375 RepID=A0A3S9T2P8_9FIRM|nr:repressor LexA [Anoxybacter fermentans]
MSEIEKKGYPPSVREIAKAVDLRSPSTVHSHLNTLEELGYIRKDPTKPRTIEVLVGDFSSNRPQKEMVHIPIVGKVTAGQPILAVENIEDFFPLPLDYIRGGKNQELFMLQIKGNSMVDAGILDGDYVIVRKQSHADNGDIVVALLEDEATVKRFFKEKDYIRLQPENSTLKPILVRDVQILGKVIGVYRNLV